ncbi:MAG TPA: hypothetical protein VM328_07705 [Fimbriimonadaceae bacterium]|nr:hypothetical protein [Fimbriimonadaceae bacterium]
MERRHRILTFAAVAACLTLGGWTALDAKADAILKKAFAKLHAAKSFTADVTTTYKAGAQTMTWKGTVAAAKPNLFRWELKGAGAPTFVSDGTAYYQASEGGPYYFKNEIDKNPTEMMGMWEGEVDAFFGGAAKVSSLKTTYVGTETVGGTVCDVVKAEYSDPPRTTTFAIGQKDSLIYRAEIRMPGPGGQESVQVNTLSNIKLNATVPKTVFAFKPAAGQKLYEQPDYNAKLVKVGDPAPDWTLPTPNGGTVSLSEALKGKKALLVNFWFYG